jgi:protein disulfide-isomerase
MNRMLTRTLPPLALTALTALILSACSPQDAAETTAVPAAAQTAAPQIEWQEGAVDEALAQASDSGKPVLLYWGAKWCPPCNQLSATVFKRPEFIEQTRHFVAVHLDGDSEGAQQWGEYFGIAGYPTLIILRGDRTEMMRISGGTDVEQFPKVLALALKQTQPVKATLETALSTPKALSHDDWTLLALYGWEVDQQKLAGDGAAGPLLARLAAACPEPALAQRFALLSLATTASDAEHAATALAPELQPAAATLLEAVLSNPQALQANLIEVQAYGAKMLIAATAADGAARGPLAAKLFAAMDTRFQDPALSVTERFDAIFPEVDYWEALNPDAKAPDALIAKVKARAQWADQNAQTPQERQAVISDVSAALDTVGASADAEALLVAEVPKSKAAYYYMVEIAGLAEKRGDKAAALDWLKRAYDTAEGPATRVQWGLYYVNGLIELTPENRDAIETASAALIDQVAASPNGYYQRTRARFAKLESSLEKWAPEHQGDAVLARLHGRMMPVCATMPDTDSTAKTNCQAWLAPSAHT